MEWAQNARGRHWRRFDPERMPEQGLRDASAQCRDPDLERRRLHRFRTVVLRTPQRTVLRRPRLEAVRGRDLRRTTAGARSLRCPRAVCLRIKARAAAGHYRPMRAALVSSAKRRDGFGQTLAII